MQEFERGGWRGRRVYGSTSVRQRTDSLLTSVPLILGASAVEWNYAVWLLILGVSVPLFLIGMPFLFIVPAVASIIDKTFIVRHGIITYRIPFSTIEQKEAVTYPPSWNNIQYFFPQVQWVCLRRTTGRWKTWYIPTSHAAQLVAAIRIT
jgi:hypothetical protein